MMSIDVWVRDNWAWLAGGAAGAWGVYQWLRTELRVSETAAVSREDAANERLWARLNTYVDDLEKVVGALRVENRALHDEISTYRIKVRDLEDVVFELRRQVCLLRYEVRGRPMVSEDEISAAVRTLPRGG